MRVLIIEDEVILLEKLKGFFEESFPDFQIEYAMTFDVARVKIIESEFDIGIFDTSIKDCSIIDLLYGVSIINKEIIFLTDNQEFALKAFEYYALDCIVKPYDNKRLYSSVKIASRSFVSNDAHYRERRIKSLTKEVSESKVEFIALPNMDGIKLVPINQIVAVEAERSYSTFHLLSKETITISKSLIWAENNLKQFGFYRVHRSWLVSPMHVSDFLKKNGPALKMSTGLLIDVTEKAKSRIFEWLKCFTISD
jgi:two-component system LytT family response regulator